MAEDADFLKYDMDLLWARSWIDSDLITYAAKKHAILDKNLTDSTEIQAM